MRGSVLVVDDDADTRMLLSEALRRRGFDVGAVGSGRACLERLRATDIDVVVTDVRMPGMTGIELCSQLQLRHPELLSIVLTGASDVELAIAAIRGGVFDFIAKPVDVDALEIAILRAMEHLSVRQKVRRIKPKVARQASIEGLIGESSVLRETIQLICSVAQSDATVLITGESGTGKELVARALQALSARRNEPFVGVNCAAIPATLLESELFGHVRGSFTDAKSARAGLFVQAGAGTIFLDEIGEMPLETQVKLLRVLQQKTVRPVGSDEELPFHARVVAATNRDLGAEVLAKRFREDLFYRINVVAIPVPPLRARRGDIMLLSHHILKRVAERTQRRVIRISADAARKLLDYEWPGNVRELENCLERAVAVGDGTEITVAQLPRKVQQYASSRVEVSSSTPAEMISLGEISSRYVRRVLSGVGGNKTRAARVLGIDRRSLYRRLEQAV